MRCHTVTKGNEYTLILAFFGHFINTFFFRILCYNGTAMRNSSLVSYDHSLMLDGAVGRGGMPEAELAALRGRLGAARETLLAGWKSAPGFFGIPERKDDFRAVRDAAKMASKSCRTLVVIGIGGSDLGARAILRATKQEGKGMDVRFIGANTDPEEIAALLATVDLKRTMLNVISKSGDTIEPMSAFLLLRDRLIKAVGKQKHRSRVIATTDAKKGTLRMIADREKYATLAVPADIGGRFSALTTVGLFPAACAGVPFMELVDGMKEIRDAFASSYAGAEGPLLFAGLHHEAYARRDRRVTVLMPYADGLRDLGLWFRQLWAESLGKRRDRSGMDVRHGFTPVAALGATDQHSQVQLYNEGPADKIVTFIEVVRFRKDFRVPNPYRDIEGVAYMAGRSFSDIIHAERKATAHALMKSGMPSGTLSIPSVSPRSVGALMGFFMLATAATAELLDVDAYDQPGVEEGKRAMYALLGRKGYSL
jgi:glucose-6-phosphate isomerase